MTALRLGLLSMLAATFLVATSASAQSGERSYDFVSKILVDDDSYLYINVSGSFAQAHGCSQLSLARSKYPINDERTKALMQLAIASFLSRNKVHVSTTGCTLYGHPVIDKLQLHQE
jgi:alpha-galactosidase